MNSVSFKMKKNEKTPWEKRYLHSTNTMLFGKPKKKLKWHYLILILAILLVGLLLN